ncbi:MAG: cell division protein FtsA [Alistipes sp.]
MEKKSYTVGVDIGSSNVVVSVGWQSADGLVRIEDVAPRSVSEGVTSGRIDNVRSVGLAIREAKAELEEELGIRIESAYAGISGPFVRCASYTDHVFIKDPMVCITKEDLANLHDRMYNVVAEEGEVIIDRILQHYAIDDKTEIADPVGAFGRKLSATYLFVLCRKAQIERTKMAFYNAGLKLLKVCVNPAVLASALLSDEERDEGVAIVDIGGGTTDLAIIRGNKLRYMASLPIGAATINADMHAFGIAERNTEKIKKTYGSAVADLVSHDLTVPVSMPGKVKKELLQVNLVSIIEARLKDIIEFVWDEIRQAKFSTKIPCGIVLTGGSALLENIDELFRRETGLNVRCIDRKDIRGIDEESQQKISPCTQSAAVAVMLFGATNGACEVVERAAMSASPVRHGVEAAPKGEKAVETVVVASAREESAESKLREQQSATPVETSTAAGDEQSDDEEQEEKRGGFIGMMIKVIGKVLGNDDEIL